MMMSDTELNDLVSLATTATEKQNITPSYQQEEVVYNHYGKPRRIKAVVSTTNSSKKPNHLANNAGGVGLMTEGDRLLKFTEIEKLKKQIKEHGKLTPNIRRSSVISNNLENLYRQLSRLTGKDIETLKNECGVI